MNATVTFLADQFKELKDEIFSVSGSEGAAFLLCGESGTASEVRLLVREVIPILPEHYLKREYDELSIDSQSYANIAKRVLNEKGAVIFVHSHPGNFKDFSKQDKTELAKLHEFFSERIPSRYHGSIVLTSDNQFSGRLLLEEKWEKISKIRIIGKRFIMLDSEQATHIGSFFDRQVLVFGEKMQEVFSKLHIGVVGAGGTGSCVAEQIARLGVGEISIFDDDALEDSNISRVFGSTLDDVGKNKAEILAKHISRIGIGTKVNAYTESICKKETAMKLRDCDIIFGCTDSESPRGILNSLSHYYLIPFIDVGVVVSSSSGIIQEIVGRITTVFPGEACLFCRKRISPEMIAAEGMNPERREKLAHEKYAPELQTNNPSVITFTAEVACQGVTELIHRLADFKGSEYNSTETLMMFDQNSIKTNTEPVHENCVCNQQKTLGIGDKRDFIGLTWQN